MSSDQTRYPSHPERLLLWSDLSEEQRQAMLNLGRYMLRLADEIEEGEQRKAGQDKAVA